MICRLGIWLVNATAALGIATAALGLIALAMQLDRPAPDCWRTRPQGVVLCK
ncbi:hypothetical protein [Bradyrhizobium sp. SZCCHNR3118]|uniref:hypothetical protein n=1 Tax=Bradyrhizobium sp. SZCCHNR3118 TaxID=3057468 RepID=UPI002916D739|nr:hypothetical protein [Bradyrhizobium sp. SZCCHNR3118]